MEKFKTILKIGEQANLGFGLVALLTIGGEHIFSTEVFKCPCNNWNFFYGMVFLLVPAMALLVLGYILNKKTWKLVTGICLRGSRVCRRKSLAVCGMVLFQISTTALVAPFSWIAVALLNGNYFECIMTGINVTAYREHLCGQKVQQVQCQEELYRFPCGGGDTATWADREDVLFTLRAESQILGWLLIASIMATYLLLLCVARCNSPISYVQLQFWRSYTQEENCLMESYSTKHAKELAERNLKSFFQQEAPKPIVTPTNLDWQRISSLYRFNRKDQYYSTLHQYVESLQETDSQMMRMASIKSTDTGADNPAVLGFVDDGRMVL
ncbi:hypothetical protein LDENG_00119600 [Lucifuga dentata]|nr:hypothetical protein LDENG_00119600 [Lucifuga dentata]